MKGLRFLVVAVLLGAAAFAAGQGSEYLEPDFTECWGCHAPGLWNPDMDPNYVVTPLQATPEVGQEFELRAELLNAWLGEQRDMAVTLDISEAPSLRFVGGKDPLLGVTSEGRIDVEPGTFDPGDPTGPLTQPSRGSAPAVVPEGATDVRIVLQPDNQDPTTGPKIAMRVYDARTDRDGRPTETVPPDGPGAATRFVVNGASEVAAHGFGNWTIEGEVQPISPSGETDPQFETVRFTVTVDAWFNATEAVEQVASRPGPVQPGAKALFSWQLHMVSAPGDHERIEVVANATTFYKHDDVNNPDFVNTTVNTTAPVETRDDGKYSIGLETLGGGGGTVVPAVEGVGIDRISEVVGYVSAVLLLSSIWTGGIFGKASRRQLNVIFGSARRRVAFHNVLSYGIIAAATVHTFIFLYDVNGPLAEDGWPWLLGIIWGSPAVLGMIGLGATGALQVPMIRRWNYGTWRWIHFGLAIATMVFTLVHMLLDGANFTTLQNSIGYQDPLTA